MKSSFFKFFTPKVPDIISSMNHDLSAVFLRYIRPLYLGQKLAILELQGRILSNISFFFGQCSFKKKCLLRFTDLQSLSKERKWTNCSLSGHNFLRVFADAQARFINDPIQIMLAKFFETVFWAYTIINFQRCISQDDVTEFVFKFISSTSLEKKYIFKSKLNCDESI